MITGHQLAAARVLLGLSQAEVAGQAQIAVGTLRRMEASPSKVWGMQGNVDQVRQVLEVAGVVFIDQNGAGPGVRLRDRIES